MNGKAVCVDASLVLQLFLGPDDVQAWELWDEWTTKDVRIHAPGLLGYEVTNALHRCQRAGMFSPSARDIVLEAVFDLPIEFEDTSGPFHRRALAVAVELGLPATYDAHYLALARTLDVELWTNDSRLHRAVGDRDPRVKLLRD